MTDELGESGGDFAAYAARAASGDLCHISLRLALTEDEKEDGLGVGVQFARLALGVDAADQRGVENGWHWRWRRDVRRGVVSNSAAFQGDTNLRREGSLTSAL